LICAISVQNATLSIRKLMMLITFKNSHKKLANSKQTSNHSFIIILLYII